MLKQFAKSWASLIYRNSVAVLLVAAIVTVLAFNNLGKLAISTNLEALMPQGAESVKTLNNALKKTGSFASIQLVAHSDNEETTLKYIKDAQAKIDTFDWVSSSQYYEDVEVLETHKLLLLSLDQLLELEARVNKAFPNYVAQEISKQFGSEVNITLRDENLVGTSSAVIDKELMEQFQQNTDGKTKNRRYFVSQDGLTAVLVVWPNPRLESLSSAKSMISDVNSVLASLSLDEYGNNLKAGVGGRIANKVAQFDAIINDVKFGLIGSIFLIGLLLIFSFRSLIVVPSIFIPLSIGILWTLGLTAVTIGGLNLITIFLTIILFGLGIDFGIHNFSRYREERRNGLSIEEALQTMVVDTGSASLIAALTTAVGFYSLLLTDFRAFTEFGFIAGSGVLLTYVSMYTIFPAIVVVLEKSGWWHTEKSGRRLFKKEAKSEVQKKKRNKFIFGSAIAFFAFSLVFAPQISFERNFKNLEAKQPPILQDANAMIHDVFPDGHDRAIIVVETLDALGKLDRYFKKKIKEDTDTPTIKKISSLLDFLPAQAAQKKRHEVIKRLEDRAKLSRAFYPSKYNALERYLSIDDLNLADMPDAILRTYIGTDSEPGYLMYVFNSVSMNNSDDAKRYYDDAAITVVDGKTYNAASEGFIFVEMIALMKADALKAIVLVILATAILVFVFIRKFVGSVVVLIPALFGVFLTVGIMGAFGPKLSIINMVILPSLIGIAVDNSIHIFHRFEKNIAHADIDEIMNNTGRAAVLTTLTTMLGFGGMVTASMGGLRSMGILAIIGFVACLVITWTLLPALLEAYRSWIRRRGVG
ncbi:MAG: MMPL family transporter [Robiginitomaculum sp.]